MPLADQSLRQGLHRRPTTSTIPDIDVEPPVRLSVLIMLMVQMADLIPRSPSRLL